jgi:hypothetical protein
MPVPDRLCSLVESRLPLTVESDGSEGDWNVVGPAMLAAVRHLRAIVHVQETFPSGVIGWQLVRSMFEYVTTYAWVAAEPGRRTERSLKYDYVYRAKLDNDFRGLGATFLADADRDRVLAVLPNVTAMPDMVQRTTGSDEAWADRLQELNDRLGGNWPEDFQSFRRLYPIIYRNGSRFTHPSSHVVDAFVTGHPPRLVIGDEKRRSSVTSASSPPGSSCSASLLLLRRHRCSRSRSTRSRRHWPSRGDG